jgi:hypothetical protein
VLEEQHARQKRRPSCWLVEGEKEVEQDEGEKDAVGRSSPTGKSARHVIHSASRTDALELTLAALAFALRLTTTHSLMKRHDAFLRLPKM